MLIDGTESGFTPTPASAAAAASQAAAATPSQTHAWKDGGSFSFHDVLDTLNPLQHIPVVNAIYRWATGDQPGNVARIVGDGIYGGPIGLAAGMLAVAVKEETGKDPGEMAMAALTGSDTPSAGTAIAAAAPKSSAAAQPVAATLAANPAATASSDGPLPASTPQSAVTAAALAGQGLMPLFRSPPTPSPTASAPATGSAEQAFLAQNAMLQRSAYGARGGTPSRPITAPIPLELTGSAMAPPTPSRFKPLATTVPLPTAAVSAAGTAPAGSATATPAGTSDGQLQPTMLPQNPAVEIPQRMMDALDKYMQMQQQAAPRGNAVDTVH
jgi:hypothetical protein